MYSLPDAAGFAQTQAQVRVSRTSNSGFAAAPVLPQSTIGDSSSTPFPILVSPEAKCFNLNYHRQSDQQLITEAPSITW